MRHFSMKVGIATSQASKVSAVGPLWRQMLTVPGCCEFMPWEVSTWTDCRPYDAHLSF